MAIETEWEDRITQARRERQVNADAAARRLADATAAADRSIRWLAAYRRQPAWRRLVGLLAARAATRALDGARDTLQWATPMAAAAAVGADPRRWGVFSGCAAFHLEATLDQARLRLEIMTARMPTASRPALRAVGDQMVTLKQSLPRARVAAWRSPEVASVAERELAQQVVTLAGNLDALTHDPTLAEGAKVLRRLRRRLLDHLPAEHRPLARSIRELDRPVPEAGEAATAACVSVTEPLTDDGPLALHDLVVHRELRGLGAGTAALQEVLAFADHAGMPVVAEFMPSGDDTLRCPAGQPSPPADLLAATARWYHRHGFRVGDQPPERWQFRARMCREPHSLATGPPTLRATDRRKRRPAAWQRRWRSRQQPTKVASGMLDRYERICGGDSVARSAEPRQRSEEPTKGSRGPPLSVSAVRANRRLRSCPCRPGGNERTAAMAHSPRHQAARQRGAQTGERFEQAWEGIPQDRCDYQRPIPDAATLAQQRLEAAVVYALVEGLRHEWGLVDRGP